MPANRTAWCPRTGSRILLGLLITALVPSERACRKQGRRHKPLLHVGRPLALQARRWLRGRDLVLVGGLLRSPIPLFLDAMRRGRVTAITRLRLDAALYDPAPPRPPGTIGRPRTKGGRLPTLAATLVAKDTPWHKVVMPGWYGAGERTIEIASDTAVWRHGGLPVVPIRWVLIRDGSPASARRSLDTIAPLVPPPRPRPKGGRRPIANQAALTGILFVLRSGLPWERCRPRWAAGAG